MKYINFKILLLLLVFSSCDNNSFLKDKLITNTDEIWVVDDFTEVGHIYGYKFDKNKYSYYIVIENEKKIRRFDSHAEGEFYVTSDSIINYYFEGKISFLEHDSCVIRLKNDSIQTLIKKKFINYKLINPDGADL